MTAMAKHKLGGDSRGFTIPELAIAIVFMGIVATSISQLFLSIQDIQRRTAHLESATHAAQTEVESLRNNNYNTLVNGQDIDFTASLPANLPKGSGHVAVSEPMTGLKRVDVTVSYNERGETRQVKLSSLIGIIGISQ
jgi:type II secretory pathway pseudopilin PulG